MTDFPSFPRNLDESIIITASYGFRPSVYHSHNNPETKNNNLRDFSVPYCLLPRGMVFYLLSLILPAVPFPIIENSYLCVVIGRLLAAFTQYQYVSFSRPPRMLQIFSLRKLFHRLN